MSENQSFGTSRSRVISFNLFNTLSTVICSCFDLSNEYWLYGQCTRHINFRKVFDSFRKMNGHSSAIACVYSSKCGIHLTRTVIAQGREIESARIQFLPTNLNILSNLSWLPYPAYALQVCMYLMFALSVGFFNVTELRVNHLYRSKITWDLGQIPEAHWLRLPRR